MSFPQLSLTIRGKSHPVSEVMGVTARFVSWNTCFTCRPQTPVSSATKLRLTNIPQTPAWKQIPARVLCMLGANISPDPTGLSVLLHSAEQTGGKQTVQSTTQAELIVLRENGTLAIQQE